jgi:hypothetical protein
MFHNLIPFRLDYVHLKTADEHSLMSVICPLELHYLTNLIPMDTGLFIMVICPPIVIMDFLDGSFLIRFAHPSSVLENINFSTD